MAPVTRFLMISAWCAGLFALSSSLSVRAQDAPSSFGGVSDLVCPNAAPAPPKPVPGRPAARVNMSGTQMPSDAELGPLARTTIRPQPLLDAQTLAALRQGLERIRRNLKHELQTGV